MLTRSQKEGEVAELRDRFGRASSVLLADYRGLSVSAVDALRRSIHAGGPGRFEYRVAKNTLIRRAASGTPLEALAPHFEGPTALAFSFDDPVALAKLLVDYAKEHEVFELKAGVVDGRPVDPAEIADLATLPSLEQLRGQLAGLVQAPATKLVRLFSAPGGQLARLMTARSDSLGGGEAA